MAVGPNYRRSEAEISLRTTYKHMRDASSTFHSKRMFMQSKREGERREGRRHAERERAGERRDGRRYAERERAGERRDGRRYAERERAGERWDTVGYDDQG
ncbi:hypothetical protein AAC387_Pa03g1119 [Persea americana]